MSPWSIISTSPAALPSWWILTQQNSAFAAAMGKYHGDPWANKNWNFLDTWFHGHDTFRYKNQWPRDIQPRLRQRFAWMRVIILSRRGYIVENQNAQVSL
jgi:hypothetical protein